jgi:hypothetical protein
MAWRLVKSRGQFHLHAAGQVLVPGEDIVISGSVYVRPLALPTERRMRTATR